VMSRTRPRGAARRKRGSRLTKRPGLLSDLHAQWERFGEHEPKGGTRGAWNRIHKEPGVREREVVAPP
jgi:hypothetical protein